MSTATKRGRAEAARQAKEALAAQERKRRALFAGAVAVVVLIVAGLIGWAVWAGQKDGGDSGATPPAAGFTAGTGPVAVDIYADFMCPACNQFEQQTGPTVDQLAAEGKITVTYHPIAILDRFSNGTQYSTRAAAASAAAAEGGKFVPYLKALYAQQPAEGTDGLSDDRLVEIGRSVGLGDEFAATVKDGTYRGWAKRTTDAASERGVTGTPTIYVAGQELKDRSPAGLQAAVAAANP
ncbi:DsbA family protein [Spirilliplanes yamanashiensis]|uniref:Membrane protein n=1 Tax=Spirilliplanes yamanashiensis TaxID=42233 RepID=A0A8J4DM52_9ACTN|nr:thioredoxin domain-containing protein [Spirilliplanes yamanashiensis]MDP9816264.1 protein-disulfide isomerase [Spirilliplanes yamanashiensis]GIJ05790.1 membrane protein [Spirilliplanes yamanashiensis]